MHRLVGGCPSEFEVKKNLSAGVWVIKYRNHDNPTISEAVIREIDPKLEETIINSSLLSENIVQIYEIKKYQTTRMDTRLAPADIIVNCFLIEEFCDNGDLMQYKGNINEETLKRFMLMLIKTLKAMHKHGITHRDISPGNIFMMGDVPKFGDLNDCKKYIGDLNTRKGKVLYYSPLQMSSKDAWNSISNPFADDIWCLGKVFFECAQRVFGIDFSNTNGRIIEQEEIESRIISGLPNYTEPFKKMIIGMMKYDESERLTARKAYKMIRDIYYPSVNK
ncbi:hypothetical protein SteCoe_25781 [Stentor coeruleus]|uniref:Protein kinase domain-containing protein n=1 Tax=Stentor coeruleus TaxID=5963 RepID=A0A1R2BEF0_9CILI|nr:hypothetical protein SteCoe_25781 [Stentor coeruleus]